MPVDRTIEVARHAGAAARRLMPLLVAVVGFGTILLLGAPALRAESTTPREPVTGLSAGSLNWSTRVAPMRRSRPKAGGPAAAATAASRPERPAGSRRTAAASKAKSQRPVLAKAKSKTKAAGRQARTAPGSRIAGRPSRPRSPAVAANPVRATAAQRTAVRALAQRAPSIATEAAQAARAAPSGRTTGPGDRLSCAPGLTYVAARLRCVRDEAAPPPAATTASSVAAPAPAPKAK